MTATAESPEQVVDEQRLQVAEYKPTAAALAKLRQQYDGVVYDVRTTKGMKDAKEARKTVRGYRTSLENKRKEIKAPALQRCRDIDDEAKIITAELRKLEEPIDEQIKAEEQRKQREKEEAERRERERVDKIRADIEAIRHTPADLIGKSAAELGAAAHDLRMQPIGEDRFAEFAQEALAAKQQAMQQLASMIEAAKAQEELAEMKRKQAEQEAAKAEAVDIPAPAGTEPEPPTVGTIARGAHHPIDTRRLAAAAEAGTRHQVGLDPAQPGGDRTVVADVGTDSRLAAIRADLIGNAGLYSTQADAVIESIQAGRIRYLSITE